MESIRNTGIRSTARNIRARQIVGEYLKEPVVERLPEVLFLRVNKIRRELYEALLYEKEEEERREREKRERKSPQEWLEEHYPEMLAYTFESARKGNAQSQKLFAQLAGKLVEKTEVRIGLTADEYSQIRDAAKRRAEDNNRASDGARSLLTEPALLPDKVREDTGREQGDNTV